MLQLNMPIKHKLKSLEQPLILRSNRPLTDSEVRRDASYLKYVAIFNSFCVRAQKVLS